MINVSPKIKAAFQSDSMSKTYYLLFPEVTETQEDGSTKVISEEKILTNINFKSDSISLKESICSEEQLHFGCNEAATFEIEIEYEDESLVGRIFNVYLKLGNYEEQEDIFTVGRYRVDSEEISTDRQTKKLTAYDANYLFSYTDITYFAYMMEIPATIEDTLKSLFEYVQFDQVEKTLINGDIVLSNNPFWKGEEITEVSFESFIKGILEVNACFGHISRDGKFDYISLTPTDNEENYPSKTNYPSPTNFPKSIKGKNYYVDPHLIKSDITWQNYKCKTVDTIQVRNTAGTVLMEYHIPEKTTYTNIYVIQNNWVIDALDSAELEKLVLNFANAIKDISYTPVDANVKMDLSLEVGDAITLTSTKGNKLPTFILSRTMTGVNSAFDEIEATGYEEWINDAPDSNGAINDLSDQLQNLTDRVSALEQGQGDGNIKVESVDKLPTTPKKNVIYLVQGKVNVY